MRWKGLSILVPARMTNEQIRDSIESHVFAPGFEDRYLSDYKVTRFVRKKRTPGRATLSVTSSHWAIFASSKVEEHLTQLIWGYHWFINEGRKDA